MLVSKIKPCMSQYKLLYGETANDEDTATDWGERHGPTAGAD